MLAPEEMDPICEQLIVTGCSGQPATRTPSYELCTTYADVPWVVLTVNTRVSP
jgi:hypothetical protein